MKQLLFTTLTGFLFLIIGCNKHDYERVPSNLWQKLNTPYFGTPLDIKFTSADTGYILGAKSSDDSIYNILIKTNDCGQTWESIAYKNHQFLLDTSNGLMGGIYVSPFNSNIIFSGRNNLIRSTDGGLHWQIINPVNQTSFPVYFFDPKNGIGAGVFGISTTTDGGITWEKILANSSINRIQFPTRETGYASFGATFSGIAGGFFSTGGILKTNDGVTRGLLLITQVTERIIKKVPEFLD